MSTSTGPGRPIVAIVEGLVQIAAASLFDVLDQIVVLGAVSG
jgi:hypothetical protein